MRQILPLPANSRTAALLALTLLLACVEPAPDAEPASRSATDQSAASDRSEARVSKDASGNEPRVPRIVFLGNSLTAGFGLGEQQAFPAIIGRRLAERGIEATIVNAGVSGDTSAGGLTRLEWLMRQQPDILAVGLGGNDGLRGLSVEMTERNLRTILASALESGSLPVLLGLKLPPNLGPDYVNAFESIYPRLAAELDVMLVPFMLEGVAGDPKLNLPDGIHPTAAGHEKVADNVLPWIEKALLELPQMRQLESAQKRTQEGTP